MFSVKQMPVVRHTSGTLVKRNHTIYKYYPYSDAPIRYLKVAVVIHDENRSKSIVQLSDVVEK